MHYTLFKPRMPNRFHGAAHEDDEDLLVRCDFLPAQNLWDDTDKLRHVYFSVNDGARAWCENRAGVFTS